jgi:DNA invertase Pin-like site-specific DNA recombinase
MTKVVIFVRVSTDKQDYQRQINELTDYCNKIDWEIIKVFKNKVSGFVKNEEREEIQSLVSFVKENQIDKVVCLEVSRIGRNTLESLKIIQFLNENHVSLYIKNYNMETLDKNGNINPITSLICTILLEISSMERLTIKERMESGRKQYIERCRRDGIKMGRPSTYRKSIDEYKEQYHKELSLLKKGYSLSNVSKITGVSINTIKKIKDIFLKKTTTE